MSRSAKNKNPKRKEDLSSGKISQYVIGIAD